jgi:hypothetical protein
MSSEKNFTVRYKASARQLVNFGSIDPSFEAKGFEVDKV